MSSAIEWGVASRPLPGQSASGDLQVVKPFPGGVLITAVDGVGHGGDAATAAMIAREILEAHPEDPVITLVQRCHEALRFARGVAMNVASFNIAEGQLTWLGIGNVAGVLLRQGVAPGASEKSLLLRAGVVGFQLPHLLEADVVSVSEGDTLIFATDGIDSNFARAFAVSHTPQKAAESILAQHGKTTDDALVLVVRFLPGCP